MRSENLSVALIGVDGGSWNVLRWLIREGYIPNLKRLVDSGVYGDLKSNIPPVTGGAWLSLATGLNPGKTGIIDFFKHVGNWVLEPVSAEDYKDRSLWDFCSLHGLRVAVLDYPTLYPAYPVNGIMVSSWSNKVSTYPPELVEKLRSVVAGDYDIFVNYHLEKYNDIELFLEDLSGAVERKLRISEYFMKMKWNLFVDVFSYTDWLQHRMWHYIDPSYPWYPGNEKASRYKRRFAEFWQILDEYIGEVIETYDVVFIVSDHGFGSQWGVFNLGKWVIEHGYAEPIKETIKKKLIKLMLKTIIRLKLHRIVPQKLRRKAKERGFSLSSPSMIFDVERSRVIVLDYTIPFGAIHINPKQDNDVEELIERFSKELSESLKRVKDDLKVTIWRVKDLYHGDKLRYLPDAVFTINNWSCVIVKDPDKRFIYLDAPYSPRHTGSHRPYGIFLAYGEDIKRGTSIDKISILDIAPTILHILKLPIPDIMDGRVLIEIFDPGSNYAKRSPRYVDNSYYVKLKLAKKMEKLRRKIT
ncbi:MAG: alkaline phosphatase family protein [Thermoprotei archaeon]